MTILEAIKILEHYQSWRVGSDIEMIHPKVLTKAIDLILNEVKKCTKVQ